MSIPIPDEKFDLKKFRITEKTFEEALARKYVGASVVTITKMSRHISHDGLSIEEACLLEGMDYDQFMEHVETDPLLKRLFLIKQLRYKQELMGVLTDKAREGDKAIATWLAEKKYANEYGKNAGKNTNDDDLLKDAIQFVRDTTSPDDIITQEGSKLVKKKSGTNTKDASLEIRKYLI